MLTEIPISCGNGFHTLITRLATEARMQQQTTMSEKQPQDRPSIHSFCNDTIHVPLYLNYGQVLQFGGYVVW